MLLVPKTSIGTGNFNDSKATIPYARSIAAYNQWRQHIVPREKVTNKLK